MGATAAVAIIVRKERELVEIFTRAGATSPVAAKTLDELNVHHEGLAMRRLRSRAVVRESGGRYYVDLESWEAVRRMRHRMILVVVALVVIVLAGLGVGFFSF
jgi:hypothetical protein